MTLQMLESREEALTMSVLWSASASRGVNEKTGLTGKGVSWFSQRPRSCAFWPSPPSYQVNHDIYDLIPAEYCRVNCCAQTNAGSRVSAKVFEGWWGGLLRRELEMRW